VTERTVEPGLLATVQSEAAALAERKHPLDAPLGIKSELLEFTEQAFDQAFRSTLKIEVPDFTQAGKEEVLALARDKDPSPAVASLLNLYVDVCNIWPDVLSEAYGGSSAEFLEFRTELIPTLLAELIELAKEKEDEKLAKVSKDAAEAYSEGLERAS